LSALSRHSSIFEATHKYLDRYGKPLAFYSDKASIFRVNKHSAQAGKGHTQFGRALYELNIDGMCANTPTAKGRVERAHQTPDAMKRHGLPSQRKGRDAVQGTSW